MNATELMRPPFPLARTQRDLGITQILTLPSPLSPDGLIYCLDGTCPLEGGVGDPVATRFPQTVFGLTDQGEKHCMRTMGYRVTYFLPGDGSTNVDMIHPDILFRYNKLVIPKINTEQRSILSHLIFQSNKVVSNNKDPLHQSQIDEEWVGKAEQEFFSHYTETSESDKLYFHLYLQYYIVCGAACSHRRAQELLCGKTMTADIVGRKGDQAPLATVEWKRLLEAGTMTDAPLDPIMEIQQQMSDNFATFEELVRQYGLDTVLAMSDEEIGQIVAQMRNTDQSGSDSDHSGPQYDPYTGLWL